MKTHNLIYTAICTALIAVCSWISIPTAVPFTLQLFAVFLTVELLGGKLGTLSVFIYILLGTVGVPVFAGFAGGPAIIAGPLGGFVVGFLALALAMWLMEKLFRCNNRWKKIFSMLVGLIICYAFGVFWFMASYANKGTEISFTAAVTTCVIPFLTPDLIKLFLAAVLAKRLKRILK